MSPCHAFIINMASKRPDRRRHMTALMADMGWDSYEFVEPVEGVASGQTNAANMSLRNTLLQVIFPRAGQMGLGEFVVFEDDVMTMEPRSHVVPRIDGLLQEVKSAGLGWDMIYLEYCLEACSLGMRVTPHLNEAITPFCAAAILFNGRRLQNVVGCMERYEEPMSFTYSKCIREGRVRALVASPPLFAQDVVLQGDLNHRGVHMILNWIMKMYDPDATESSPRLPHCVEGMGRYFRLQFWILIFGMVILACVILFLKRRTSPL
jgi:hypothetical protein